MVENNLTHFSTMKTELLEKKHIFDKFDQTLCKLQKKNVERANNASMLI